MMTQKINWWVAAVCTILSAAAMADTTVPAGIALQPRGHGSSITTAAGITLYVFLRDVDPAKSACNGDCAKTWPPLLAPADAAPLGDWTLVARGDGQKQWAFRGKALYTYNADEAPGQAFGDGQQALWFSALIPMERPPGILVNKTLMGQALADPRRFTLYTSLDAEGKVTDCADACGEDWKPVTAPWTAADMGDWTVLRRASGINQWAFKGHPLYRYDREAVPGEAAGERLPVNGARARMHAMVLEPPPALPEWVTIQPSDAGELLADARGMTLYTHNVAAAPARPARTATGDLLPDCGLDCSGAAWKPVLAKEGDKPVGNWSIVATEDGKKQWAYKGKRLYTYPLDEMPGDFLGVRQATIRTWTPVMRSGERMQGTNSPDL